ncbi:uncharacterized protein [Periplaneta americana]|uniref:uncharacterized protein n=1 Tax=Periplaneta americana TaxID=6978 RepID=UPI0037E952AD
MHKSDSNIATQQLIESGHESITVSTEMLTEVTRAEYVPKSSLKRKKSSLEDDARKALKMAENFANVIEDEFDVFGKFMATELSNITDKALYHETKWKIIQVMTKGVRRQMDMNSSRDVGLSTSSASSRSRSDINDHNYYYSGVSVTECDEYNYCDN